MAIVRIRPGPPGPGAPIGGKGWLFRLVPGIDSDLIASQLRINQLGGSVQIHPETGEVQIGALYRDALTGQWQFDLVLGDLEAFGLDTASLDAHRAYIVRRSGGSWRPPALDPGTIRAEIAKGISRV